MANHQLNDPDFDPPAIASAGESKHSALEQLSPKTMFIGGIVMGAMILCTIGFFILLSVMLRGGLTKGPQAGSSAFAAPEPSLAAPVATALPTGQAPTGPVPPVTNADHVRGDRNAQLSWIEYSDIECPFCKRFHPTMLQMMQEYKGKIKWVYRHFPLSFHQNAQKEAEASDCAAELGGNDAFWKYVDVLFERTASNGTGFALDALAPLAKEIGLNEAKFKNCLDSGKYAQHVIDETNAGAAAGVNGTPGSFLIGKDGQAQLVSGALPYEQIKALIDAQLK